MRLRPDVVALTEAEPAGGGLAADLPITVVMNAGAGSDDKSAARAAIAAALAGRDLEFRVAGRPRDIVGLAQAAAKSRGGVLAAAGGDGTLNAVAAVARDHALVFGAIPLGTFNYFAREFGIPEDPGAAARNIVAGAVRRLPVGEINGRLFLNNASIGLYRRLIEQREVDKHRFGRSRFVALVSALLTLLREHRPYRLSLSVDGRPLSLSTLTMFFGRNALQLEQLGLAEARCVAAGELAVLALREVGRGELLGLALRGALAQLQTADNLRRHCAATVRVDRVDGRPRRMRVAIDGELIDCTLPLTVRVVPDALQVVVPHAAGDRH